MEHDVIGYYKKTTEKQKESRIDIEDFREIYKTLAHRAELRELFHAFSSNGAILPDHHLAQFLRNEQYEADATEETAFEIILKYEPVEEVRRRRQMSFEGFIRYMNSEECLIFQNEHRSIYQDMTQPLCDYFISSAHNLIPDQLIGPSDLWGYTSALLKGCRCLEIDCWDGSNNEPVVCHGHNLRRKILFRSVIAVIGKYAFVVSDYPVILSLENHCSPKQQEVMAHYLETILGDRLLTSKTGRATMTKLPSPEELKFKILVKTKRKGRTKQRMHRRGLGRHHETKKISEKFKHFSYEDQPNKKAPIYKIPSSSKKAASKRSDSVTEAPPRKMAKMKRTKIGIPLSDLVIYTKSKRLVNFDHSLKNQKCYENNSIEEVRARKLIKDSARKFISHTTRFITRIFPKGTRTKSCNYNPQEFWNLGCQMVALNFQTLGVQMDLQHGKFLDNGGCGYILKPEFLRNPSSTFTPDNVRRYSRPVSLSIKLISGHQLPPSSLSKTNKADPLVHIEIYGVPEDQAKRKSRVIKCNAFSPRWDETLSFLVHIPELALIRFCVEDEISLVAKEFLGQYTLPLTSLSKGYHTVPLFSKDGGSLKPASLFVHVWYCE